MADLHVVPIGDLIDHDTSDGTPCVCGPTERPVEAEDGSVGWIAVHHCLDGREQAEG